MILTPLVVQTTNLHLFKLRAPAGTMRVNIAGTFNNWNKDATPMTREADGITYSIKLALAPGRYLYKFILDGDQWITDPNAKSEDDGEGNTNSIFLAIPKDFVGVAKKGDGIIAASALLHLKQIPDRNYDRGVFQVSLRVRSNDVQKVSLLVTGQKPVAMRTSSSDEFYTRMVATFPWDGKKPFGYTFELTDGDKKVFFGPNGVTQAQAGNAFAISKESFKPFPVPRWVESSVLYQIFPDRFYNSKPESSPEVPWDAKPTFSNWFGGNSEGVRQKLPYLKDLGISGIYFTPIFEGPSNHRYETTDYRTVDHRFGTNQEFKRLVADMRSLGMKSILDTVFNHTSVDFFAFKDIREKGEASVYKNWFNIKSYPIKVGPNHNYEAWFGFPSLPKLNVDEPAATKYLLDTVEFWVKEFGIDGFRLDVGNEVSQKFWKKFRTDVKRQGSEKWILGEVWGDGSQWLKGDQWDSVMNYPFLFSTLKFVGEKGDGLPSSLWSGLMNNYSRYAPQVSRNLMNLLGSHDTARVLTQCGGNQAMHHLAAILQFSWVGTPCIYYGDELGMDGGKDPDNRKGMEWYRNTNDNPTLTLYKKLINLRTKSKVLQSGNPELIAFNDSEQTLTFARVLDGKRVVVSMNRSSRPRTIQIPLSVGETGLKDSLFDTQIQTKGKNVFLTLAPYRAAILMPTFQKASSISSRTVRRAPSKSFALVSK